MNHDEIIKNASQRMDQAVESLISSFASVRTGRANSKILDRIKVDYYGTLSPIEQLAGIKVADARTLIIEPWDKSALASIEKAIQESDLGLTPNTNGGVIRLPFPELSEERRRDLVKQCKSYAEEARVAIRNVRRDSNSALSKAEKAGDLTEDDLRLFEGQIQKITDEHIAVVDENLKSKETELMEV